MIRPRVAALAGIAAVSSLAPAWSADPTRRPNVGLILADDLGYADLGFEGGKDIPTPNLESLLESLVRGPARWSPGHPGRRMDSRLAVAHRSFEGESIHGSQLRGDPTRRDRSERPCRG
jgi:hypothetical protein